MARFIKPIDLWIEENRKKILEGRLVLQTGQWVYCGKTSPNTLKSRYVSNTEYTITVVHGPCYKTVNRNFGNMIAGKREVALRLAAAAAAA